MRARTVVAGAAALLTLLACVGDAPPAPAVADPLRVPRYYWPGQFWVDLAAHHDWFTAEGLAVELVDTNQDYIASLTAVVRGELDMQTFYMYDLVRLNLVEGADLVAVLHTDTPSGAEAVVARPGVDTLHDLRGRRVGLQRGSFFEQFLELALRTASLELDDVELVDRPRGEEAAQDLASGLVDAVATWEPFATEAQRAVGGKRLIDTSALPRAQFVVLALPRSLVEQRPHDVHLLLRIWKRGADALAQSPHEVYATIGQIYGIPAPEVEEFARLDDVADLEDNLLAFAYGPGLASLHGAWAHAEDFLLRRGLARRSLDSTQYIDPRFVRELR